MKFFYYLLVVFLLLGCSYFDSSPLEEDVVVSLNGYRLTLSEIQEVVPDFSSNEDSVFLAQSYIDSWVKEHVLLNYAENFLGDDQKNFDYELTKYRNSLLIYAYEKEFLKQNLDTVISERVLKKYYQDNPGYFILKENIVQVNYFILPDSLENIEEFKKIFYHKGLERSIELEQYCIENNAKYYFAEEEWMYVSDLKEKIPMDKVQEKSLYKNNHNLVIHKEGKLFFLKILRYDLKDNKSPLSLQTNKIKDIILNQRKIEILNKLHQDIYLRAKDNNLIKEYDKN